MNVHHPHAEPGGGCDRAGDGMGNVVEFQIEEHTIAAVCELLDQMRPLCGEQAAAYLESASDAAQPIGKRARVPSRVDVKRD